jgi:hypothetical protein
VSGPTLYMNNLKAMLPNEVFFLPFRFPAKSSAL